MGDKTAISLEEIKNETVDLVLFTRFLAAFHFFLFAKLIACLVRNEICE